jgi:hypothetical protein
MSQPPWETQPQPGWGPPPPPPQQPGAEGGWNQGPYQQPFPQQGAPQDPQGYQQYPPQGQGQGGQYGPQGPQFPPPYPSGGEPPHKRRNNGRIAGIVGTAILLVAGCATVVALASKGKGSGSAGDTAAPPVSTPSSQPTASSTLTFPDNSFPNSGAPSSGTASTPSDGSTSQPSDGTATTGPVDPASLDSAATDKTPFTAAALVASTFKDDKNVVYNLKAAAPKSCDKVGDAAVAAVVKTAKCTQFLAASWMDPSGRIIVSAMIVPYQDAATAKRISDKLGTTAHTGDYNQWCPPAGQPHADVCTKLTSAATREGKFGSFHRYLLITTAVYTDLRNDDTQKDWLNAAASMAFQNTLPGM